MFTEATNCKDTRSPSLAGGRGFPLTALGASTLQWIMDKLAKRQQELLDQTFRNSQQMGEGQQSMEGASQRLAAADTG